MLRIILSGALLLGLGACDRETQEKARERQAEAQQKIKKLGTEAKAQAQKLNRDISETVQPNRDQASAKLDNAALLAKVKAKLASDVGLKTVSNVNVDTRDSVVTLRGTVANEAQRQEAERAAAEVSGVTKVVNELKIAP